jgi:alpha-L-fucosidase 2
MNGERPLTVTAVTQQFKPEIYSKVDDEGTIVLTYPRAQAIIQASWNWPFDRKDMEVYGRTGYVITVAKDAVRRRLAGHSEERVDAPPLTAPYDDSIPYLAAVARGQIKPSGLSALDTNVIVTEILEAARTSARTGKTVDLAAPGIQKDVEYARPGGKPLLFDAHVPDGLGPFPVAILVHGGGFDGGSRSTNVRPLFDVLSNAGFAWFSIDYRMAPEFHFTEAMEDVDSAIRWVKANAGRYHIDPAKIVIVGESAGGFLVNYAGTHSTPETKVAAVVDIYGPADYGELARARRAHPERFDMKTIDAHAANGGGIHFFGVQALDAEGLAKLRTVSPIAGVHPGMPPFLCIHGTKDDQVPYEQSTGMCEAIHKAGARCDLITIDGGGHGMGRWREPEMQHWKGEMIAWLQKTLDLK